MEQGRVELMTGRTLRMPALIVAAVLVACALALLAFSEKAEAAFPGKNGTMAYTRTSDGGIHYSPLEPGGGAKTEVAGGYRPSFSPDGNGVARAVFGGASAREAPSGTSSRGFKPGGGAGPAYRASEKLQLTKTEAGARVTLNWVYAEENYLSVGYQVENLDDKRRVAGHPAELQPILGFGYGEPTPREEKNLKKYGLGTDIVALTDERDTKFRMADNSGEGSFGPKPVEGPLENLVAFRPKKALKPGKDHDFRLQVPLYESAIVPLEGKQPPPEPFPGDPFVFDFDVPVHAVHVVDVDRKAKAKGVTLRLDRVIDSPGRPRAVVCYLPPDDEHVWFINGGAGTLFNGWSTSGWSSTGSAWGNPPKKCHKLIYSGLWPGIDMAVRGDGGNLKYEFYVKPGSSVEDVRLGYRGAEGLSVGAGGELLVRTSLRVLKDAAPVSYQHIGGERVPVKSRYKLTGDGDTYGFAVGTYDPRYPLVIDPGLDYSTFLGGTSADSGLDIAVDGSGRAYVTGRTTSLDYPTTRGAFDRTYNGDFDAFVTKLNASGSALVYSTFLGGTDTDEGTGIAVREGRAYVTGGTTSANFPTTPGTVDTTHNGGADASGADAFVTKLNASGSALDYSTFLGGADSDDVGEGIAVDGSGRAYVTGATYSADYPTTQGAFDTSFNDSVFIDDEDAFVTKLATS